jgi:transcriptional regulator with XRE-family HTH domain
MNMNERLKELRIVNDYSQKEVADYLGVDQSYVSKIEKGERKLTDISFDKLCLLYNCSPDYLLGDDDHYESPKIAFRADEKVDLHAISKMNQVMGHLKVLRQLERDNYD